MPRSLTPLPPALARAAARFARWRAVKTHRRLPPRLCQQATTLARQYGVSRTAQALGMNYARLRQLTQAPATMASALTPPRSRPGFVEVLPPGPFASADECVLELERPDGTRARMRLPGGRWEDWGALAGRLWGGAPCSK